jgi:hypothetical protein
MPYGRRGLVIWIIVAVALVALFDLGRHHI